MPAGDTYSLTVVPEGSNIRCTANVALLVIRSVACIRA